MRLGSLCSGYGGLDLAAEHAFDATTAWHCETDPAASAVLDARWSVPNHGDLTTIDWATVEPIHVLAAGWPCQPWSMAGKRKGANDVRAIWPHIARAVRELRPRHIVLENVPAVVVLGELARATGDLAEAGFDAQWCCVSASDVGAPHKRERLFIVATDTESDGRDERQPEPTRFVAVGGDAHGCVSSLLPTPTSRDHKGRNQRNDESCLPGALLPTPAAADGSRGQDLARATRDGSGGDDLITVAVKASRDAQWGKYAAAIQRWEHLTRPAPSPTEPNSKGNPRLSARFVEWMMGLPDGWVTDVKLSRPAHLKILGNGVVPAQAAAAIDALLAVAETYRTRP